MKQHRQQAQLQLLLLLLTLLVAPLPGARAAGSAELFLYGDSPVAHGQHAPWTYDAAGEDWSGTCSTGQAQSPINLPLTTTAALIDPQHRAVFELGLGVAASNGTNVILTNTGHSVRVSWAQGGAFAPKITLSIQEGQPLVSAVQLGGSGSGAMHQVVAVPQQFHFHAHSEHLMAGRLYPLEVHLVSVVSRAAAPACPASGCLLVTAVMFELADDINQDNPWLEPLFEAMPLSEGEVSRLPPGASLDVQQLLPANASYVSYAGSLTTPPCTEGVLWLVMSNTQKLSLKQWRRFMTAVSDYSCTADASNSTLNSSSSSSSSNTTKGSVAGRRLLAPAAQQTPPSPPRELQQHLVCSKLGAGANYRLPQPLNGRQLRVWREQDGRSKAPSYLPEDAATAASAGAVAGIVLGTTLGAGLTALTGWVVYREYQKRRLKRFYKYGVSGGDMLSVQREVETQWLGEAG